jgi:anti-anti-sigma factor
MAVEVLETATGVLFRVRGEVGIAEAGALGASLSRLVAGRPTTLTFDLSELLFISSLALAVLKAYRGAAVRAGARVRLAPDLHPVVREALDRAELTALFESVSPAC